MSNLPHILLIPIGILAVAVTLKLSGATIYRKSVGFKNLDEQIRAEIEESFRKTYYNIFFFSNIRTVAFRMSRLSHFEMDVPAKIVMQQMKNEEGNTFNEPFLVGNSHKVRAQHYMPEAVDDWCSGIVSKYTQHYFEHKNRRIHVTFDCNRNLAFPPLRTIVGWCIVGILANAAVIVFRMFVLKFEIAIKTTKNPVASKIPTLPENEKPITFDDYIVDDDYEAIMTLMEDAEKWDASKLESCYD
ncbi:hypothetical protein CAEBREN_12355 [Caenorhabditis brenneri]|uniref:Uncharacterized protein n=1 Tax=Caenorhabditis brenneri TaxID=135651 RepID=G0NN67_CAEBE|nr:hypothetical protein CAEBREN_12355 [Caenorhabditis brenneri]